MLWQVNAQDAAQQVTQATLGNGLTQTRSHNPHTGRMDSGMVQTAGQLVRLQEGYRYDALGSVERRTQYWDTNGFIEDFGYDELNRLTSSQVVGLPAQSFTYDAAGNITTKTGAGTYTYPPQGASAVRPHAVQSASGIGGSFGYDDNGNLTSGAGRTATWTSFDMPVTITKGGSSSTFVYGPEHQRAKQTRNDGTVILYAGAQEVENKNGQLTVKTYWPSGVGVEIDRPGAPTELNWTHVDRLGSPVAITDSAGNLREKLAYDAWGKRRTTDGSATPDSLDGIVDNKGFTKHEMLDQLDLVHMNGRVYDPLVARFLSGDPIIQDPLNGQNYSRYTYVFNNPTNLTDPTGFRGTGCTGSRLGDTPCEINQVVDGYSIEDPKGKRVGQSSERSDTGSKRDKTGSDQPNGKQGGNASGGQTILDRDPGQLRPCGVVSLGCKQRMTAELERLKQADRPLETSEPVLELVYMGAVKIARGLWIAGGRLLAMRGAAAELKAAASVLEREAYKETQAMALWTRSEFQGARVYQRSDLIDVALIDARGRSNLQRMQQGLAPIGPDGKSINLHHMQSADGPLAEMTTTFHQRYATTIHINPSTIPSGIDRPAFDSFRRDYWINRAKDFLP